MPTSEHAPTHEAGDLPATEAASAHTHRDPNRIHLGRRIAAFVGIAIISPSVLYGAGRLYEGTRWDKKKAAYEASENALLGKWQKDGAPIADHSLILRAGVKVRQTPDMLGDDLGLFWPRIKGNVAFTVKQGEVLPVIEPGLLEKDDKTTWFSFQLNYGQQNTRRQPLNPGQIAKETFYVNYSQIKDDVTPDGQPVVSIIPNAPHDSGTIRPTKGELQTNGQFRDVHGNTAAFGRPVPAAVSNVFARLYGVNQDGTTTKHPK